MIPRLKRWRGVLNAANSARKPSGPQTTPRSGRAPLHRFRAARALTPGRAKQRAVIHIGVQQGLTADDEDGPTWQHPLLGPPPREGEEENIESVAPQRHWDTKTWKMTNQRECDVEIQLGYAGEKVAGETVCSFLQKKPAQRTAGDDPAPEAATGCTERGKLGPKAFRTSNNATFRA